jgi:thiol-disulfide isomerase/thioredoxin
MSPRSSRALTSVSAILAFLLGVGGCSDSGSSKRAQAESASPPTVETPAAHASPAAAPDTSGTPDDAQKFPLAPDFALSNVAGGTLRLSDLRGKVVLLDFWATWCGPCRMGIPHLNELYKANKQNGLEVVGISVDRGQGNASGLEVVRDFAAKMPIQYSLVMADGPTVYAYGGIRSIPTAFLIDRTGHVRKQYVGLQPKEVFEHDVQELLTEKGPTDKAPTDDGTM